MVGKKKNRKKGIFSKHSLLLKQTLFAAWKSKLQLVILLLLTFFATSLITGSWISYQRIIEGTKYLQLDDVKFDSVLPYDSSSGNITQIANQAFSLRLGRLYYDSSAPVAVYYDNTIIGQEIKPLTTKDLKVSYIREGNMITSINEFQWVNPNKPLEFNLENKNVKASIYGQLILKAEQTHNLNLKNNYLNAASNLYNDLFINFSANQILNSLKSYFSDWIKENESDPALNEEDQKFTDLLLDKKINYQGEAKEYDLRIPDEVNVAEDIKNPQGTLATKLVRDTDKNPRLTSISSKDYGMNGQWMQIYRKFDVKQENLEDSVISNFSNQYSSPSNYNLMTDSKEPSIYSHALANAVAALQSRRINVINQFVATSGIESSTGKSISVKVVNLGLEKNYNNVNLKVFEGIYPSSRNQIAISPQYARAYNIKPGDTVNINAKPFIVSAIAGDAYNIYPTINLLDSVPNTKNEFIIYVFPDAFYDTNWFIDRDKTNVSIMYFIPWKNISVSKFDISYFNDYFQKKIFGDNKIADRYQYDYNKYLIEKYIDDNPDYLSKYSLDRNLVVTEGDGQFNVYAKGRNLLNTILSGFKYFVIVGIFFLVLIIIFITYLIIRKTIQKGQISMGILKSSGYSTWKIIVSYLVYPFLVLVIAIPFGWFIGLVIQVYFTEIFNSLFMLPYNVLDFKFIPLFISIALICGFVLITTLITGYKILQKEPLVLIKQNNDILVGNFQNFSWLKEKLKNNFKIRFLFSLSRTSWKKITVTAIVIAVATLAITSTVSIPATISNMKNTYFKTQKYKNNYHYQSPIPNMPLSKYGLYSWNNLNNIKDEPYYPISGVMPWPENIIITDKENSKRLAWYNPIEYDKINNNFKDIVKFDVSTSKEIQQNIIKQVGDQLLSLNNGPLDINLLTYSFSWMGGRAFSNALLKDLSELDKSINKNFSNSLITFVNTILPEILNVPNPGVSSSKDTIVEILKQTLPGFVRQVLDKKGPNAYDYFSIGHNSVAYNPNYNSEIKGAEEELITQFQLNSNDKNLVNRDSLEIEGINPDTKMLVMNSDLVEKLRYNSLKNVIPMIINNSFATKFGLSVGREFEAVPIVKTLYYLNNQNKLVPLPKSNWYYGNDPGNQSSNDDQGTKLIWSNSANKWNYRGEKLIKNTDYNDSYGYNYNGVYDKDGDRILSSEPSSWNDINKIWLKLPSDITLNAKSGSIRNAFATNNLTFNIKNIASSSDENWIKPFSYNVADEYYGSEIDPTDLLMTRIPEWYGAMLDKKILVVDYNNNLHSDNFNEENIAVWWKNIVGSSMPVNKYHIIGIQNSYDTPRAYVDQKWANLVLGYSYYNDRSDSKDPIYAPGTYQWFSGKLSASDDIYDVIARMSFKRSSDDYSIYSMTKLNGNQEEQLISNSDLLLKKREMLEKLSNITLSASLLFIIVSIICSILIVIMITDAFTDQFRKFMSHMKAEGYTNQEINSFTLGIFTPWVFVGYIIGYGLGFLTIFVIIQTIVALTGFALPLTFIWWIVPLSFAIIAIIYFSTFIINNYQLNRMNLISLLKTDE